MPTAYARRREVGSGFQPAADFPVGVYAGPKPGGSLKGRPHSAPSTQTVKRALARFTNRTKAPKHLHFFFTHRYRKEEDPIAAPLKNELQGQLQNARIVGCLDLAEGTAGQRGHRVEGIHVI
jgi:hypothetical protein